MVDNASVLEVLADGSSLPDAIKFLLERIATDQSRLELARAAFRVSDLYEGVALECLSLCDGDVSVSPVGLDVYAAGRRGLVFRDERSGEGWSARLHFRLDVKRGSAADPGSFDYASKTLALDAAMAWAAIGCVVRPTDAGAAAPD